MPHPSEPLSPAGYQEFAAQLRRLRSRADLTQEALAERAGLSSRLISAMERGSPHRPRRSTVELLADALELTGAERTAFLQLARGSIPAGTRAGMPIPADRLIGRDADLSALARLLHDPSIRCVTLVGPGGVGKTRLAIEAVARNASISESANFIEMAAIRQAAQVLPEIAFSLGIVAGANEPVIDALARWAAGRRTLLVLDNLEQVVDAGVELARLLQRIPELTVLATSRRVLHIRGEHIVSVEPLALPDCSAMESLDGLRSAPAVELFLARARAADSTFELTPQNAGAIAEIVRRLDGLPLAIELAAARVRLLLPAELLARLDRQLSLLEDGAIDLAPRLRSLRAAIAWSYDLLEPGEQRLFCALSVFAGGFSIEGLERCLGAGVAQLPVPSADLLAVVETLLNQSLLQSFTAPSGDRRFRMLETIREFAAGQLSSSCDRHRVEAAVVAGMTEFAEIADGHLLSPNQEIWLRRMEEEQENVIVALDLAIRRNDRAHAARLVSACTYFWRIRSLAREGRAWAERVVAMQGDLDPRLRGRLLTALGAMAFVQADYARANVLREAIDCFETAGDDHGAAVARRHLGHACRAQGDFEESERLELESLQTFLALGDTKQAAISCHHLGLHAHDTGDLERAERYLLRALELGQGRFDGQTTGWVNNARALVALASGDYGRANQLQLAALDYWLDPVFRIGIASSLENFGLIGFAAGQPAYAVTMLSAAYALRRETGAPGRLIDRQTHEAALDSLRAQLDCETFRHHWERGASLDVDELHKLALDVPIECVSGACPPAHSWSDVA
jgi:predicted ATPase/DNA-binding XRE family transcriptional regulator